MTATNTALHDPRLDDSEFEYAGFWERFLATLMDGLLSLIVFAPLIYWEYVQMGQYSIDEMPWMTVPEAISTVLGAVVVIAFWVKKGATPGKMLFGLQVRDAKTGKMVSIGQGLLRYIGYYASAIVFCLGYIWAGFDKHKQGWHDKIASTVVVKRIR
ncbi:RDD family protein [Moraxella pluranimalium]|uniref:Transporter n=1 Tax=Moraxella pluranimalium TaxID=470453 RepID=A0A1T0CPD7_9GAMM|nr:RDD family protein [Moraxella pluranimalium]OOS24205.1 transporter [Moraxella pluranimalium]